MAMIGSMRVEASYRVGEGGKGIGCNEESVERKVTAFKTWALDKNVKDRMNVLEMNYLRIVCGVRKVNRIGNNRLGERCSNKRSI